MVDRVLKTNEFTLEGQKLPYINLRKILNTFLEHDSCGNRLEEGLYQFVIYTTGKEELIEISKEIINLYDYSNLQCENRKILSNLYLGKQVRELEPGLHNAILNFEIIVQKQRSANLQSASGKTFGEALRNLSLQSNELSLHLTKLFLSNYALENQLYPFGVLEGEVESIHTRNSCYKLLTNELTFAIYGTGAENVEFVKEKFMQVYDYAKLFIENSTFVSLLWQADDLEETEPGLWRGGINYELILGTD